MHILKPTIASLLITASMAQADTTLTTTFSAISLELDGTTYSGAYATSLAAGIDVTENVYATASFAYFTASGGSAAAFDAGVGYMILNDIDYDKGTGAKLGAGITLSGNIVVASSTALSSDIVFDAALSSPYSNLGSVISYSLGAEYVPWGIYAGYQEAVITGTTTSLSGFNVGYRTRF